MPRFLGHASTYLALLGMILVSAVVTYQGIHGSIKSQFSRLAFSISGVQASPSQVEVPVMADDIADFIFQEEQRVVIPTFDEDLLESDEELSEESNKVRGHFARMEKLGEHLSDKLSGR